MLALEIRPMTLEDLPRVMEIEKKSFIAPWAERIFRQELTRNRRALYLVAIRDKCLVGYVGMWLMPEEIHITSLAVDPLYRRQGIARVLIQQAYRLAQEHEKERITLEVRASNQEARYLYRKEGFYEAGIKPGYYSDNREDAIIMTRKLRGGNDHGGKINPGN